MTISAFTKSITTGVGTILAFFLVLPSSWAAAVEALAVGQGRNNPHDHSVCCIIYPFAQSRNSTGITAVYPGEPVQI
jgi:hypothetical protein